MRTRFFVGHAEVSSFCFEYQGLCSELTKEKINLQEEELKFKQVKNSANSIGIS